MMPKSVIKVGSSLGFECRIEQWMMLKNGIKVVNLVGFESETKHVDSNVWIVPKVLHFKLNIPKLKQMF